MVSNFTDILYMCSSKYSVYLLRRVCRNSVFLLILVISMRSFSMGRLPSGVYPTATLPAFPTSPMLARLALGECLGLFSMEPLGDRFPLSMKFYGLFDPSLYMLLLNGPLLLPLSSSLSFPEDSIYNLLHICILTVYLLGDGLLYLVRVVESAILSNNCVINAHVSVSL